jgi:hypothetical protein
VNLDLGVAVSPAQSLSSPASGFQEAGTYINFGAGTIAAPQDNNVSPTASATSTATASAKSPTTDLTGAGGAGITAFESYLPFVCAGAFLLALLVILKKP